MPSKSMTISLEELSKLLPKDIKVTQLYIHTKFVNANLVIIL